MPALSCQPLSANQPIPLTCSHPHHMSVLYIYTHTHPSLKDTHWQIIHHPMQDRLALFSRRITCRPTQLACLWPSFDPPKKLTSPLSPALTVSAASLDTIFAFDYFLWMVLLGRTKYLGDQFYAHNTFSQGTFWVEIQETELSCVSIL